MPVLWQVKVTDLDAFVANSGQEGMWPMRRSTNNSFLLLSSIVSILDPFFIVLMSYCRNHDSIPRDFDLSVPRLSSSVEDQDFLLLLL